MKALPMYFRVDAVSQCDLQSNFVDCTIIRSFIDDGQETGLEPNRGYRIRLAKDVSDDFSPGDELKVITYAKEKPVTAEDYLNFEAIGRRIEIKNAGEELWNLVTHEMYN